MATEATHGESVSSCVDAAGGAIGMPQLCFEWFPNQMFWLVVTLVAIFFILSRIALPRIAAVLAERADTITNDLAAAENLKKQAEEAEEAFNKALIDARAEAQNIAAQARAEIQAELDSAIADADAKISAKAAESEKAIAEIRATAMENVEVVAKDTTAEIVTLFGGKADAGAIADAVAQRTKG